MFSRICNDFNLTDLGLMGATRFIFYILCKTVSESNLIGNMSVTSLNGKILLISNLLCCTISPIFQKFIFI
jgi:hypothetical protein